MDGWLQKESSQNRLLFGTMGVNEGHFDIAKCPSGVIPGHSGVVYDLLKKRFGLRLISRESLVQTS